MVTDLLCYDGGSHLNNHPSITPVQYPLHLHIHHKLIARSHCPVRATFLPTRESLTDVNALSAFKGTSRDIVDISRTLGCPYLPSMQGELTCVWIDLIDNARGPLGDNTTWKGEADYSGRARGS